MATQEQLPSMKQVKNKKLVKLATSYVEKRDKRAALGREEVVAKQALILAMKDAKLDRYEDNEDDLLVLLVSGKDKLKVKTLSDDDGEEDDE